MTTRIWMVVACALLTLMVTNGMAQVVPADWKTDCVGRMQIGLPGEVDIAAILPKDLIAELTGKGDSSYKFLDGQGASWSRTAFMRISHPISPEQNKKLEDVISKDFEDANAYYRQLSKESGELVALAELPKSEYVKLAWRGRDYLRGLFNVDKVAMYWAVNVLAEDKSGMKEMSDHYQTLLTGLRPRPTFDVPKVPGVCLPYLFIQDDGKEARHIGMTYRLKDHPDITVWLEDGTAAIIDTHQDPAKFTANAKAAFFWEQRYQNRLTFQSLWPEHKAFKPTTFAGQPGTKTFVELTRNDDKRTKDYGYLIAVRGDPDAEKDTPDLMLYVIQDSANAVSRGIKPLSKAAFFKMAETIAASVQRREVSAP